jgi:hypothetical protein
MGLICITDCLSDSARVEYAVDLMIVQFCDASNPRRGMSQFEVPDCHGAISSTNQTVG